MIPRELASTLQKQLSETPVVALLGSRQVGKTTLARSLNIGKSIHYLDLERPSDVAKLADPELYLGGISNQLVILDEIQRLPDLFPVLRSLVDERRRAGEKAAQFLILGSASPELLQQSSETLAGRISYLELPPFNLTELPTDDAALEKHWYRGGYPDSYLAANDDAATRWCNHFITSYVERYLPQLGVAASPLQLRRFCSMIAHQQGATLNLSKLAGSLGIDGKTARHYLNLLEGLYLVRSLPAWSANPGKRLVKSPKVYWRDTGLLHALTGLHDLEQVLGHPICGHSWEGYCIEQILTKLPETTYVSHYRTRSGSELDLVLEDRSGALTAIEIKRTVSPKISRGFTEAMQNLNASQGFFIIPKGDAFPLSKNVTALSLTAYLDQLA
jgi:uncharacterized protein